MNLPIACDMSTAVDTPEERLAEYRDLFATALVRRERREHAVVFVFRAAPGLLEHIEDLARREEACCPFMEYRVESAGDEVSFTFINPGRADIEPVLDAVYALVT